jgi:hypothetical protein
MRKPCLLNQYAEEVKKYGGVWITPDVYQLRQALSREDAVANWAALRGWIPGMSTGIMLHIDFL